MSLHLVTGHKGEAHVSALDVGVFNVGIFGRGTHILPIGSKFDIDVLSNNAVAIYGGELIMQGRHVRMHSGLMEQLTISNGTAGYNRIDLIVIRYTQDTSTGVENVEFAVIEGTPTTGEATIPAYTTGDLINPGCRLHELPLYKIPISGLVIGTPEKLISEMYGLDKSLTFSEESPLIENDTVEYWKSQGCGIWKVDSSVLDSFPISESTQGFLLNIVGGGEVSQEYHSANGSRFRRRSYRTENVWYNASTNPWVLMYDERTAPFTANSYKGTGTYGADGACRLNFSFKPKFVIVLQADNYMFIHHHKSGAYKIYGSGDTGQPRLNNTTFGESYVEWYSSKAEYQMNESGVYYYYMAWG